MLFVNAFYDVPAALPADPLRDQLRAGAERTAREAARSVPSSIWADSRVIAGRSPARSLYECAEEREADLIVVGSSGSAGEGRVLAGRVASQVVDGAPCAVAIAPAGLRHREKTELRRIGVGFDGHRESEGALSAAVTIARAAGARLLLIAVVEPVVASLVGPYVIDLREINESLRASARDALEHAGHSIPEDVEIDRSLLEGDPGQELERATTEDELDLLVVGSRGFGPVRRVLLGSVSTRLMHGARCPLLVVPRRAASHGAPAADEPREPEAR